MIQIRLPQGEWEYDQNSPLGRRGGFGEVFAGRGEKQEQVAVKRLYLKVSDAAHRELRIAEELIKRPLTHVVPVLDAGKDAESDRYFVVMPRAEKSLQQEIDRVGTVADKDAVSILRDIAAGLLEVKEIVHRDLKPDNVLYHEGRWKVADFGIARFVEESTSLRTLKRCLTPPYAAPEQWRLERATSATDIYALGCIAYALLTGAPPFKGPDYRDQHLHAVPPPLIGEHNPRLCSLVAMMLRKPSQARPSLDRVVHLLEEIAAESVKGGGHRGLNSLMHAGAADAQAVLNADAAQMERESKQRVRKELADSAFQELFAISETLSERVLSAAPTAKRVSSSSTRLLEIQFGYAKLILKKLNRGRPIPESAFQRSGIDVVAGASIWVIQQERIEYRWGANLWYTDLGHGAGFRWWEFVYMNHPLNRQHAQYEPFALDDLSDADLAGVPEDIRFQLAAEPRPVDDEDIDDFCERWAALLAKAYHGHLRPL